MRKLIALAALLVALPSTAGAQEAPRGPGRIMMASKVEFLVQSKDELTVTPEQAARLEAIASKFREETAALRKDMMKIRDELNAGANRQQIFEKLQPIREQMEKKDAAALAAALAVLSAEQQVIARQLVEPSAVSRNSSISK